MIITFVYDRISDTNLKWPFHKTFNLGHIILYSVAISGHKSVYLENNTTFTNKCDQDSVKAHNYLFHRVDISHSLQKPKAPAWDITSVFAETGDNTPEKGI